MKTLWSVDKSFEIDAGSVSKQQRDSIINIADKSVKKLFSPLHSQEVLFKGRIDWNSDFSGGSWPEWPISKLNSSVFTNDFINDFYKVDIKLNWEFNKHEWFIALACASHLTPGSEYKKILYDQMQDFMARTDTKTGAPWSATLIVAQRIINWSLAYMILHDVWSRNEKEFILKVAQLHVNYILKNLETGGLPSNHVISNWSAIALVYLSFPELPDSSIGANAALENLRNQMEIQVYPDGVHWEQSLPYHRYVMEFFLLPALAASGQEIALPDSYMETINKLMNLLLHTMNHQTGLIPVIGDGDGAKVWRLSGLHTYDVRPLLGLGAILFSNPEFKWACDSHLEDVVWLLGEDGVANYDKINSVYPVDQNKAFSNGGYYILRSDRGKDRTEVLFDCGPVSMGNVPKDYKSPTHGHADTLHFNLLMDGKIISGDPGCYSYTGKQREWHDYFRGGRGHNSVTVDGHEMSTLTSTWAMIDRPLHSEVKFMSSDIGTLVEGEQDGFKRLSDPVMWRRSIIVLNNGMVLVRDLIGGQKNHSLDFFFHLHPEVDTQLLHNRVDLYLENKQYCFHYESLPALTVKLAKGENDPLIGYWSENYNVVEESTVIKCSVNITKREEIFWCFRSKESEFYTTDLSSYFKNVYSSFL